MRSIVIYKSISGFTKKYAEWISNELHADLQNINKFDLSRFEQYDIIVYGGSLHAIGIIGLNKIKKIIPGLGNRRLIVFAVGASPYRTNIENEIVNANFNRHEQGKVKLFYLRGGFNYSKLNLINKVLMGLLKLKLMAKKNKNADEMGMLNAYKNPQDFTNKERIDRIIKFILQT